MSDDYYELLEIERTADDGTIKSSYRKLAMRWHPDKNPGDAEAEAKFKAISEAYDVLSDEQKRAAYDRYGHAAFAGGMPGAAVLSCIAAQGAGAGYVKLLSEAPVAGPPDLVVEVLVARLAARTPKARAS